jgi:hypothetical protein
MCLSPIIQTRILQLLQAITKFGFHFLFGFRLCGPQAMNVKRWKRAKDSSTANSYGRNVSQSAHHISFFSVDNRVPIKEVKSINEKMNNRKWNYLQFIEACHVEAYVLYLMHRRKKLVEIGYVF